MTARRFHPLPASPSWWWARGALIFGTRINRRGRSGSGQPGNAQGDGPVPVIAAVTKRADVPVYLDGVGTVRALNTVTVRPQVDGKLLSVNYTEGQDVKQGFVLARVDPTIYQAAYDQAVAKKAQDEAMLANANIDLQRYTNLAASNSIAPQQADTQKALVAQLEAQVRSDQAAIDNARAILSYTEITAPISGRTGIRQVDEGNIVHASDATGIVVLTQLQPISILFTLPQQNLGQVNRASSPRAPLIGRRLRPRQQDGDRPRHAEGGRQSGRSGNRHDQAQGRIPQHRFASLARPVRQRAAADRHAQAGRGDSDRRGAARAERHVRVRGQRRQHRRHAAGHGVAAG